MSVQFATEWCEAYKRGEPWALEAWSAWVKAPVFDPRGEIFKGLSQQYFRNQLIIRRLEEMLPR
jgi:hypothetical protein